MSGEPTRAGRIRPAALWLIACAFCSVSGWVLSAAGALRPVGYVVCLSVVATVAWRFRRETRSRESGATAPRAYLLRRVRRGGLPVVYLLLAVAALVGGLAYAPSNYDALSYRLPRVLHWMADGGWSWLATSNPRMNYSGTGTEWLMAPWLVLTRSDRLLFLINLIAFLLLPSLVFSVYSQLGVARRVAAAWMWITPAAYCFAMQAGGVGNDAYAAVFALAGVHFALRARATADITDAWLSLLATALLTGVKASNIPLALASVVALWPCRGLLLKNVGGTVVAVATCMLVSFLPTAIANQRNTGSWTGDPSNRDRLQPANATSAILGNVVQVAAQAVQPPVAPGAGGLRARIEKILPDRLDSVVHRDFPRFAPAVGELPQEESAGLGIGVTALLLLSLAASALRVLRVTRVGVAPAASPPARWRKHGRWVALASWIAAGAFAAKMGSEASARLLAPYYPLLIVPFLVSPSNATLVRSRLWQTVAAIACATAVIGVVLSPPRPLFPARATLEVLAGARRGDARVARAQDVYAVYAHRHDLLAPVVAHLPPDERRVGLVAGPDDPEASLWLPCCARRFEHIVAPGDTAAGASFEWVVGTTTALEQRYGTLDAWLALTGRELLAVESIRAKASSPPKIWFVARSRQARRRHA